MKHTEFSFGRFEKEIAAVAEKFNLDLENLEIEFFSPGHQAIFVEKVGGRRFRIHLSLEENRLIAVKQIAPELPEKTAEDVFAKYKSFMK